MKRQQIVDEARKWLGVRWAHQGRSRFGVDCIGLVSQVGLAFGIKHEDRHDYGRVPNDLKLMDHLHKYLHLMPPDVKLDGMVGVFRMSARPCHVGIFSTKDGAPHLVHARANLREVIEEPFINGQNQLNLVEVLSYPGLEDV